MARTRPDSSWARRGFSAPEIAEVLGVKLNTVYSRLRLARGRFEQALSRHRKQPRSEVIS